SALADVPFARMTNQYRLFRIGGSVVALGAAVVIVASLAHLAFGWEDFANPGYVTVALFEMAGTALVLLGLPAIVVYLAQRSLALAAVAYVGIWIPAVVLNIATNFTNVTVGGYLVTHGGLPKQVPVALTAILLLS